MLSKLDTINQMVATMSFPRINTLEGDVPAYVQDAIGILDEVSTTIQTTGWFYNVEKIKLTPTKSGELLLPSNLLKCYVIGHNPRFCVRGGKIYDLDNHTYYINRSLEMVVTTYFDYEDIPLPIRKYIAAEATMRFFTANDGEGSLVNYYLGLMQDAQYKAQADNVKAYRQNSHQTSYAMYTSGQYIV